MRKLIIALLLIVIIAGIGTGGVAYYKQREQREFAAKVQNESEKRHKELAAWQAKVDAWKKTQPAASSNTPAMTTTPPQAPASATVETLPKTGEGSMVIIVLITAIGTGLGYRAFILKRLNAPIAIC